MFSIQLKRPFIVIDVFTEFKRQITEDPGFLQEQEINYMEIKETLRETPSSHVEKLLKASHCRQEAQAMHLWSRF